MKKFISVLLILFVIMSNCMVALGESGVTAKINAANENAQVNVNQNIDLQLEYSGARFGTLNAKLEYDRNVLSLESTSINIDLNEETGNFVIEDIDVDKMIGTFSFKAKAVGNTKVTIDFIEGVTYDFEPFECNDCEVSLKVRPDLFNGANSIRIFGTDRFMTSQQIGNSMKALEGGEKFDSIVVTSGIDYPDALGGTYIATQNNAPIITVSTSKQVENDVIEYISNNLAENGTIYILGGTGVVTERFEENLNALNIKAVRLGGKDRFETNLQILKATCNDNESLLVCSAFGYADSLAASSTGKPIMLVGNSFTKAQKEYIEDMGFKKIYIIGGQGAVSENIEKEIAQIGITKMRVYGNNRYETSVAVAKEFFKSESQCVVVASALNFPDGLSGGPLACKLNSPLILASPNNTKDAIAYMSVAGIEKTVLLGGEGVLPNI